MGKFTVRIELHGSTAADDAKLRKEMGDRKFKQSLGFADVPYDLPPAEYAIETAASANAVLNLAVEAAKQTGLPASILLTGPDGWLMDNLTPTAPSPVRIADLFLAR